MLSIVLSTFFGAFALGFSKFFALEALCASLGEGERAWVIQLVGAMMTLGPVLAFFIASPLAQKYSAGKIMALAHCSCVGIILFGVLTSFGGSFWLYLFLMGLGSGLFSAARQSAIPRVCEVQGLLAVKVNAAVSIAFVIGLLLGLYLGTVSFRSEAILALTLIFGSLALSVLFAMLMPQPEYKKGDAGFAWTSLFPESLSLCADHGKVLLASPLLWAITGAISLAVTAFAVDQKLGSPEQASLIPLYAALGCIVGNALSPLFLRRAQRWILFSILTMSALTFGLPFFTKLMVLSFDESTAYIALSLWTAMIGMFFGCASNIIDAQYLSDVASEGRDGIGAALLSAGISLFSFCIGGLVGLILLFTELDASLEFSLLAILLIMASIPMMAQNTSDESSPWIPNLVCFIIKIALRCRYKLQIEENIKSNPKGKLFLPNHPALIDPVILTTFLWSKHHICPVVDEAMYNNPSSHWIMKRIGAIPLPDMSKSGGWYASHQIKNCLNLISEKLQKGQSILFYPAGKIMRGNLESLGANSGLHSIFELVNDIDVYGIRTRGLLGSSFSCSFNGGKVPNLSTAMIRAIRCALMNLIFFMRKRPVSVHIESFDFAELKSLERLDLNRKIEGFYAAQGEETPSFIPHGVFHIPTIPTKVIENEKNEVVISEELNVILKPKLIELSGMELEQLKPEMSLEQDLGLDSLSRAELQSWLEDEFDLTGTDSESLVNLTDIVNNINNGPQEKENASENFFFEKSVSKELHPLNHNNLQENLLSMLSNHRGEDFMVEKSGNAMDIKKFQIASLLLAQRFRSLPHQRIAILLPASIGASLSVSALLLAGKTPLMLNFTSGIKNIKAALDVAEAESILTSSRFLSHLKGVDLDPIAQNLIFMEGMNFNWAEKLVAWYWSRKTPEQQAKYLKLGKIDESSTACVLFTSGSEALPKAVPLSHKNLLSNIQGALNAVDFKPSDVMLGFLPPFHSFGMSFCTLLPLVTGLRIAYHPNPLEGKALANLAQRARVSLVLGTPAFLANICKNTKASWPSLRYAVSGAEKTPDSLFESISTLAPQAQILEGYGCTECSPVVTINRPNEERLGVGKPFDGVQIKIVNDDFSKEMLPGEKGLVLVKGPNVFSGYLNSDKNPFVEFEGESWYNTGDLGCQSEAGDLVLMGRLKRFVKIAGEMISLPAIEAELRSVFEDPDAAGPQLAMESIELEGEKTQLVLFTSITLEKDKINATLKEKGFPAIAKISTVQQIKTIPLIGTGKIDYKSLKTLVNKP